MKKHLLRMLVCLTFLFIAAQVSFFFIHYHVAELIDSFAQSSILAIFTQPIIYLPII